VNRENDQGPIFQYGPNAWGMHLWIWAHGGSVFANSRSWAAQPYLYISPNMWYYVGVTYAISSGIARVWINGRALSEVSKNEKKN